MVAHRHGFSITIDDTQQSERIETARRFLQENSFHARCRLCRHYRSLALQHPARVAQLDNDQNSGFKARGRGSHRVYVLANDGE
ncbi:MAG: hypothetical protein J6W75_03530 [Bacteroidaceae bacterium]|nr:hypothetical protein [Bacteroidaceae bacterium]